MRQLYDSKWNKSYMVELLYPIERLVLPKRRNPWFRFVDNTVLYDEIAQEALKSTNSTAIEEKVLILGHPKPKKMLIFRSVGIFEYIILLMLILFLDMCQNS